MIQGFADRPSAITLGGDKGYDAADFVEELRTINVRPHVAQNTSGRRSAIDGRTEECAMHLHAERQDGLGRLRGRQGRLHYRQRRITQPPAAWPVG
jgi:hypothetical protein